MQASGVDGEVKIMLDGNTMNRYVDWDQSSGGATITGTAIIKMEPGQKVSDGLLFCSMKLTTIHCLYQSKVHP